MITDGSDMRNTPTQGRRSGTNKHEKADLWEDPEFEPSVALSSGSRCVDWLRPIEIAARPRFWGDDSSVGESDARFGPRWFGRVGEVGSGALVAGAAALAITPGLLAHAVPPQTFRAPYTGMFRFRLWWFDGWRDVCVDDRLPSRAGLPLFSRSEPDDFTLPLLEKAYAKLHGSYEAAKRGSGGSLASALTALSGGVVQSFAPLRQPPLLLLQMLRSALPRCTILVAISKGKAHVGQRLSDGLIAGHAYCVTGVTGEDFGSLLRLRTSSGFDGHFWMSLERFASAFSRLELVHIGPDEWAREPALQTRRPWRVALARRRWRVGYNAGGPPTAPTFAANPQFQLSVPLGDVCHAVVALAQAPRARLHTIGLTLYELPADAATGPLRTLPALEMRHEAAASEVAAFVTLPPGRYMLLPYTARPNLSAAFLLRVFTDRPTDVWEANEDNAIVRDVAAEFELLAGILPRDLRLARDKIARPEVDGESLARALRGCVPAEVCRALVALPDSTLSGRATREEAAALLPLVAGWRDATRRAARWRRVSAYALRELLRECGLSVSNKVLQGVVLRWARGSALSADDCLLALARLHLAHERHRRLEAKHAVIPFSLEEMILMTIYS